MRAARGYHVVLYRSTRLRRREDGRATTSGFDSTRPPGTGSCNRADQRDPSASGGQIPRAGPWANRSAGRRGGHSAAHVARRGAAVEGERGRRAAGLHRGTAYNILRTLQAEGFVGYDEATRSYAVSLHILELAYGVLRRSGLLDLTRPLMHAVSDTHGVSVSIQGGGARLLLLLDWAWRRVPHRSLCHRRAAIPRACRRIGGDHGRLRRAPRRNSGGTLLAGHLVSEVVFCRFPRPRQRGEAIGFCG